MIITEYIFRSKSAKVSIFDDNDLDDENDEHR